MDIPKQRNRPLTKVSFECSESSASEDEDSVFSKYSCTPPSRQSIKGMQKKRELARGLMNSPKPSRSRTPEVEKFEKEKSKEKTSPTHHRWQQRETSKQRESERVLKWITSSNISNSSIEDSAATAIDVHPSDDEVNQDTSTPVGFKVSCSVFL